ncbi:multifunctional CCA addition/repair protein [Pseudoalteromonas sp. BZK2]|uniref:multifunctional CCA addition/repair protein n=1 Tax=Pseudoalteromonas sp. BZK2 TaxID=1904458 RepID=UPI0016542E49|nr:multifunctional CCA addition/repair protein [Pseudoalteromonas sp. BZK2]MBC7010683.1 multifunctional CCA addition/repair protein [Pseudoalteromonas sp. BZK2]
MENTLKHVYLVGGAVRDKLLNRVAADQDFVVVGETPETMLALGFETVGSDFPVFLHPTTKQEYALARTERKQGRGYKGFTVNASTSVTLEDDLARRDLTINAMAMSADGELIDPFNGQQDLNNKVLRHTSAAFAEDPLRVLRVARFLARFGESFSIHPETKALMMQIHQQGELAYLTPERVWKETEKALAEPHPELYFKTLYGLGVFPEIDAMSGVPQPKEHHPEGDVYTHTLLVLQRAAQLNFDVETRFAALTHDFGKATSFELNGNLHGHEQRGVAVIKAFCQRLKVPKRFYELAALTSDNHTRCHKIAQLTPKTLHKLLVDKLNTQNKPARFLQFLDACQCDAQGRGPSFIHRPYAQRTLALDLVKQLNKLDKKALVQQAIRQGKSGIAIGKAVREAEIKQLRDYFTEQISKETK